VRSVGCGLLLLAALALPAAGQTPGKAPWPTLDEARNASRCDSTQSAKAIATMAAADAEREAEKQISEGNFSLRSARALDTVSGRLGVLLRPVQPPKAPDAASKPSETKIFQGVGTRMQSPGEVVEFLARTQTPGVHCLLDVRPVEAFPLPGYVDATLDDLSKWCARATAVLADDYAGRFNRHVVRDPAYPHKDVCSVAEGGLSVETATGRITVQPGLEWMPAQIPDIATAARFGLADRVAKLIADGADIGQRDTFGFDALRWAVVRDYRQVFDLLIAATGTDSISSSGSRPDFCTALSEAVAHTRVELAAPLADRCASPEQRTKLFPSAIMGGNAMIVQALLDAKPATPIADVWEVLALGSSAGWPIAALARRVDIVRLLLDRTAAEPESSGEQWKGVLRRLLATALASQSEDVAELLLDRGVDPGPRALHRAVERKATKVLQVLVRRGADLNASHAQQMYRRTAPDALLDPLGRNQPAFFIAGDARARRYADPPIFLALDPLMDLRMVDTLLDLGADPNLRDGSGRTLLMVAIADSQIYGRKDGVGWIEPYVPKRLIQGQEDWEHRGVEAVRLLLSKGADVAVPDRDGRTALHYAARSDYNVEIAQMLLEHGAAINAQDTSAQTPLDHARAAKLTRMPEFLEAAGALAGSR
jgi:ankyrin repeat protein